jgi:epidermal growth factor receptor kinase substrate 8
MVGNQQTRSITQQSTIAATDYYKRLTEDLNKCFDDIELFVRYLEALMEYTKELERDQRRKDKKSTSLFYKNISLEIRNDFYFFLAGLKQMVEKLPDDRYFIDILQKFKHSFNLLGELKHIIHNPNAPELIHYLLSPLQFIIYTLRSKHINQLKIAQEIWIPALTRETRDLLLNCLTSKEHEILRNLGPAWVRTV